MQFHKVYPENELRKRLYVLQSSNRSVLSICIPKRLRLYLIITLKYSKLIKCTIVSVSGYQAVFVQAVLLYQCARPKGDTNGNVSFQHAYGLPY